MGRVLVVGSGAAGIAAALFMRKLGHDVAVFEKIRHTAPLIRGFTRRGLHFDTGFHYGGGMVTGILARYLDALGLRKHIICAPLLPSGGEVLRFGSGKTDFPVVRGRDAFAASVAAEFPGMKDALVRFLDKHAEYTRYSPYLNPATESFDPLRLYENPVTLDAFLDEMQVPPRLKILLGFRCLLYSVHPAQAHLRDFTLVNDAYIDDAAAVSGGGLALAEAFDRALSEAGVEVRTGCEAAEILLDADNAVKGVRVRHDGGGGTEDIAGNMCLYCGAPGALPGLLPKGALRPVFANRLARLKETNKAFIMFGVTGSDFFRHRQLFYFPEESFAAWFPEPDAPARLRERLPVYVSGGDGRDGRYPVTALVPVPDAATAKWDAGGDAADREGYEAFKRETAGVIRRQLLEVCPEFAGDLEVVEAATDVSMRRWSFNSSGSLYGKHHGTDSPPVLPVTRVGGLALAGQGIILPGLLGAAVSAAVASGSLAGHEAVLELLR